jgi:hypothetical protein
MMGMLPGMPGVPGAMQGMCGPMGAMGQMPGMQPGELILLAIVPAWHSQRQLETRDSGRWCFVRKRVRVRGMCGQANMAPLAKQLQQPQH